MGVFVSIITKEYRESRLIKVAGMGLDRKLCISLDLME